MKIIHLSDLHFHRDNKKNGAAKKTLQNVKTKHPKHIVVITGDIVDDGHEEQYQNAYKCLLPFKGRLLIAPGNHDFGAAGNFYSKARARRFDDLLATPLGQGGAFLEENKPVVNVIEDSNDSVMFIGIDTNLETIHPFDFACGEVGDSQLSSLAAILETPTVPEMKKVLFFHHHPFTHNDPFMELKDAAKLARVAYNRVDVILFGHKHVMAKWENVWGARYLLASDNSAGKAKAGEITIDKGAVTMKYASIQ